MALWASQLQSMSPSGSGPAKQFSSGRHFVSQTLFFIPALPPNHGVLQYPAAGIGPQGQPSSPAKPGGRPGQGLRQGGGTLHEGRDLVASEPGRQEKMQVDDQYIRKKKKWTK
jgi:hypothetical protein